MMHERLRPLALLVALSACGSTSSTPSTSTDAGGGGDASTGGGLDGSGGPDADAGAPADATAPDDASVSIHATGYDQSCNVSADCVLVDEGDWKATDPCCGRSCASAAINVSDKARFDAARAAAVAQCRSENAGCGIDCIGVEAYCSGGKCAVCQGFSCADAGPKDAATD
jgi:hypothetical protein